VVGHWQATESFSGCGAWTGAAVSEAGTSELRTQNEDRWSLVEDVSPGLVLLGVYDGHGGDDAAHFLQEVRRPFPADHAAQSGASH
jgi:serine/threonine protein phosphatase PrpC